MSHPPASVERLQPGLFIASLLSFALTALTLSAYWYGGGSLDSVRFIDRMTIRVAVVLFSLAYAAPELALLLPINATRRLLAHRRTISIVFVVAFALHLCAIARFYQIDPLEFWSVSPVLLIVLRGIGVAFVAVILLAAVNKGGLGHWKGLADFGSIYVAGAFLSGFAKRVPQDHFYILPVVLLLATFTVKLLGAMRRSRLSG